jgi:DNA-binding PadR family transcriptional regulator
MQSSFLKVRILHYVSGAPTPQPVLLERLRQRGEPVSANVLNPTLARMLRNGWLKAGPARSPGPRRGRQYFLTQHGRRLLKATKQILEQLCHRLPPKHRNTAHNRNENINSRSHD